MEDDNRFTYQELCSPRESGGRSVRQVQVNGTGHPAGCAGAVPGYGSHAGFRSSCAGGCAGYRGVVPVLDTGRGYRSE
ncbi:MAG: hypothetical protein WD317_03575 [Balneolaceae bacterium]